MKYMLLQMSDCYDRFFSVYIYFMKKNIWVFNSVDSTFTGPKI